jgi:N-acetylglucosaminyl-diphospho-decaprenol L-rhamnosyltransferase
VRSQEDPPLSELAAGKTSSAASTDQAPMSQPLDVAVIIVTYRTALLTIEALRSLAGERATTDLQIRVIVVDNSSEDLAVIAQAVKTNEWAWVELLASPRNGGYGYGNNLGIQHAYRNGPPDYVYFLNPDAQVRPGAIGVLVRFLECRPDVGIAGSSFETDDGTDWPIAFRFPSLLSELDSGLEFGLATRILKRWVVARRMPKVPQRVDWIAGASMLMRPAALAATGGFDENYFLYFEETDLCYRARKAGFPTWYVPDSRVMHIGGRSTSVTGPQRCPRRLPAYWFESRRRYFARTFGIRQAIVIDIVSAVAHTLGLVKRWALGRKDSAVPHYIRDLLAHSVLWPRNRDLPAARGFVPPA